MELDSDSSLPDAVPGMTLPDVVLFPQATMPLFIFEPRYRKMLADVLDGNHLMLIATQDRDRASSGDAFEPFHSNATIGLVQSSQKNPDGTSTILLQGLTRVRVQTTFQEEPYRIFSIQALESKSGAESAELERKTTHLTALIRRRSEIGDPLSTEMLRFFDRIDDPEILVDLVAYTMIRDTDRKLQLLGTLPISERYEIVFRHFGKEIREMEFAARLKGKTRSDRIDWN